MNIPHSGAFIMLNKSNKKALNERFNLGNTKIISKNCEYIILIYKTNFIYLQLIGFKLKIQINAK